MKMNGAAPKPADVSLTISALLRARRKALSVADLADLLSVSEQYLYDHAKRGTIPAAKLPGIVRFDPVRIADWWDSLS